MQTSIKCPQCGSNKVRSAKVLTSAFMWLGLVSCITIIGIPIGIILLGAAFVTKSMKYHLKFNCQECKHEFKVSESLYKEYESGLKQNEKRLSN